MKKNSIIIIVALLGLFSILSPTWAYDYNNTNQGKIFTHPLVDTSIPEWFKPSTNKDLSYRLNVLPYEEHRYHNQYIVIPAMGLVAPIVELDNKSKDYSNAKKWKTFDYNKYLENWPLIFPWTESIWKKEWNTFIFGHSNFWINKPGKFKTIFRLTYNLEIGDKIWIYKKIDWEWMFYEYNVTISKKIKANDTRAILPEKGKSTISLSSCWPIGTAKDRRFNRAELVSSMSLKSALIVPKPPKMLRKK